MITKLRAALAAAVAVSVIPLAINDPAVATSPPPSTTISDGIDVSKGVTHAENDRVPEGAVWTEHYFPTSDGSGYTLHADVLRPQGIPARKATPVILSAGPYFSHRGQSRDDKFERTGPSVRFHDLIDGADLMKRGYTVVLVDLRGFGGSDGCFDFNGPGEQADVVAGVEWAAAQSWSNGKVGMYGKSYDAVTGLMGAIHEPKGLKAVVAQEPVWDMKDWNHSGGVPMRGFPRGSAYFGIAALAGMPDDSERYRHAASYEDRFPECERPVVDGILNHDPQSRFWQDRDFATLVKGSRTPLFVAQGFTETNTKSEDMNRFLRNHKGPTRGWLGPWKHVRGNEVDKTGRLMMGRKGWFDEVMRFYDLHLQGKKAAVRDPNFVIQDQDGEWRAQQHWPMIEDRPKVDLGSQRYYDGEYPFGAALAKKQDLQPVPTEDQSHMEGLPEPQISGTVSSDSAKTPSVDSDKPGPYDMVWSEPVRRDVRLSGTPTYTARAVVHGDRPGSFSVEIWDVAADGKATRINEQASKINDGTITLPMLDFDWVIKKGHRLAIRVGVPTFMWASERVWSEEIVEVSKTRITLPLQDPSDDVPTHGDPGVDVLDGTGWWTEQWTDVPPGEFTVPSL